ncbi:MAG: flagellar biosynthetic protein FliO [Peptococcaceae bacterium]|nr:flagellar biosynthetic protein FliO [Peptococcaceae bacterium]
MVNAQSMDITLIDIESQPYAPNIPATQLQEAFSWTGLVSTVVLFLIILCLVLWLVKKLHRKKFQGVQTSWLRVLDRQVLSPQHFVYLVEVAGKIQVWGSTDHQINQITEINTTSQISDILEEIARRPEDPVDRLIRFVLPTQQKTEYGVPGSSKGWPLLNGGRSLWKKRGKKGGFSDELKKMMRDDGTIDN